jgi:hypothetical protein
MLCEINGKICEGTVDKRSNNELEGQQQETECDGDEDNLPKIAHEDQRLDKKCDEKEGKHRVKEHEGERNVMDSDGSENRRIDKVRNAIKNKKLVQTENKQPNMAHGHTQLSEEPVDTETKQSVQGSIDHQLEMVCDGAENMPSDKV